MNTPQPTDPREVHKLKWYEGCPSTPGRYIVRVKLSEELIAKNPSGPEMMVMLADPPSHLWIVADFWLDEHGWLLYRNLDGEDRVVRGEGSRPYWDVWFAEMPRRTLAAEDQLRQVRELAEEWRTSADKEICDPYSGCEAAIRASFSKHADELESILNQPANGQGATK